MEFKTSQGGETTPVFDEGELLQLENLANRVGCTVDMLKLRLALTKQANPLADFDSLLTLVFPKRFDSGLVPTKQGKKPKADPLVDLENLIRRRISAQQLPTGATSQSQQAEAMLLNALATCLLAQTMRDCNAG